MLSKNRYCHEYRRINNRGLGGLFSAKFVFEFPFGQTGLGNGKMVLQNNVDYSNLDNRYNPGSSSCTAFALRSPHLIIQVQVCPKPIQISPPSSTVK